MTLDASTARILTVASTGAPCDFKGQPLTPGWKPYTVVDGTDGKSYVKIASVLPSEPDDVSVAKKNALLALKPTFFDSEVINVRGYYVPAPADAVTEPQSPAA